MNLTSLDDKNQSSPAATFVARHFPYMSRQLKASLAVGLILGFSVHLLLGAAVAAVMFFATWRWPSLIGAR